MEDDGATWLCVFEFGCMCTHMKLLLCVSGQLGVVCVNAKTT